MLNAQKLRIIIAAPLAVLGAYTLSAASPPAKFHPAACTVTADTVRVGQTSIAANARYNEEIGDSLTAAIAPASKVMVTGVRRGATPMTAEVTLNTEQAVAGDWEITLAGKTASCTGTLSVQVAKK